MQGKGSQWLDYESADYKKTERYDKISLPLLAVGCLAAAIPLGIWSRIGFSEMKWVLGGLVTAGFVGVAIGLSLAVKADKISTTLRDSGAALSFDSQAFRFLQAEFYRHSLVDLRALARLDNGLIFREFICHYAQRFGELEAQNRGKPAKDQANAYRELAAPLLPLAEAASYNRVTPEQIVDYARTNWQAD